MRVTVHKKLNEAQIRERRLYNNWEKLFLNKTNFVVSTNNKGKFIKLEITKFSNLRIHVLALKRRYSVILLHFKFLTQKIQYY